MRKLIVCLAVIAFTSGGIAFAASTPAQKCAQGKNKIASKKLAAKLKCWQKAIGVGASTPDSTCITTAETKFNLAIGKIEAKGGCDFQGDGPTIEATVDAAVAGIANLTPATPYLCCSDGSLCSWAVDSATCSSNGGTPGSAGTVCDGAGGGCITPPASAGGCCNLPPLDGFGVCVVGPGETGCTINFLGTFVPNAICPPSGGPCVPQ
jgi:hypothetical protein